MSARAVVVAALFLLPLPARAGYTHYWTWLERPDPHEVVRVVEGIRALALARGDVVMNLEQGDGGAVGISLNGVGEDAHEPFIFPGRDGFNFCKTAQKPYDDVVTAALLLARDSFDADVLLIESDGTWSSGAWSRGAALYARVTNRPARDPFQRPDPPPDPAEEPGLVVDRRWFMVLGLGLLALLLWRTL